ncbi:glycosyltransferase [Gymnodinialimonas ceratoperidinii]|uniref:Glycosyltransferase family 2 protein n=1 Tax=Gymnodinialimonas ceratoperidinii TaxID=2856823 RepID=A0A8F6Y921_9RHOB|nr:glycosyltransferase [Gymnodinialimonas ceratoperidinii]QXT38138.1 glycosyltransferase family 2 protein [Gymnodinialimonas ceratoperidinii]
MLCATQQHQSAWACEFRSAAIFIGVTTFIWHLALSSARPEAAVPFFLTIGFIAFWRYSWWLCHQLRARIYLKRVFPRMRREAEASQQLVRRVYAVVLSYKIPDDYFIRCYESVIDAAVESRVPTTIVASITSDRDRRLLNRVYFSAGCPENVEIVAQFQLGAGKRAAIGEALRVVARDLPPSRSVTILMDGDVVLERDAISRVLPFFSADPDLAAVTTNNDAYVHGSFLTRNWYALRLAQRHTIMASMALSRKLLVLTGRYSLFRTDIATSSDLIAQVEDDSTDHWRLGEIKFLTGDDKSTWFNVLRRGGKMLYVPDVASFGQEELPSPGRFIPSTTQLMRRWFGNMLRTNGRAIALGPSSIGLFVWWSLIDQRLSIWTSLAGPFATLLLAIFISPVFIFYYLAWAILTRTVMSIGAAMNYGRFSASWPFLMYYNQIWGAFMKSWILFHPDRQSWTRQAISNKRKPIRVQEWSGFLLYAASIGTFLVGIGLFTGQLGSVSSGTSSQAMRAFTSAVSAAEFLGGGR